VPVTRHAGAFVRCPVVTRAVPALRSLMVEGEELKAPPRADREWGR